MFKLRKEFYQPAVSDKAVKQVDPLQILIPVIRWRTPLATGISTLSTVGSLHVDIWAELAAQ